MERTKLNKPQKKEKSMVSFYAGESCVCVNCVSCVACISCVVERPSGGGGGAAAASWIGAAAALTALKDKSHSGSY